MRPRRLDGRCVRGLFPAVTPASTIRRIALHELRHSRASIFIAAGVNAKALSSYLGLASVTITYDRYGHLMPGSEDEAVKLVNDYIERTTGERAVNAR